MPQQQQQQQQPNYNRGVDGTSSAHPKIYDQNPITQRFTDPQLEAQYRAFAFPGRVTTALVATLVSTTFIYVIAIYHDGLPPWVLALNVVGGLLSVPVGIGMMVVAYGRPRVSSSDDDVVTSISAEYKDDLVAPNKDNSDEGRFTIRLPPTTIARIEETGLAITFGIGMAVQACTMYSKYAGCVARFAREGCVDYVDLYLIAVLEAFAVIAPARFALVVPLCALALLLLGLSTLWSSVSMPADVHGTRMGIELAVAAVNLTSCYFREAGLRAAFVKACEANADMQRTSALNATITSLTDRMLPSSQLQRLQESAGIVTRHVDTAVSCTVFRSDLAGFTQWSSSLPCAQVVDVLSQLTAAFDSAALSEQVEKVKTIGDAYWAVSGLPDSVLDHAFRIVRFALRSRDIALQVFSRAASEGRAVPSGMRIGVGTGSGCGAIVGQRQLSYEVFGEADTQAAALEPLGRVGEVLLSAATAIAISADLSGFVLSGPVDVNADADVIGGGPPCFVALADTPHAERLTAEYGSWISRRSSVVGGMAAAGGAELGARVLSVVQRSARAARLEGDDGPTADSSATTTPPPGAVDRTGSPAQSQFSAVTLGELGNCRTTSQSGGWTHMVANVRSGTATNADARSVASAVSRHSGKSGAGSPSKSKGGVDGLHMENDALETQRYNEHIQHLLRLNNVFRDDRSLIAALRNDFEDSELEHRYYAFGIRVERLAFRACAIALSACLGAVALFLLITTADDGLLAEWAAPVMTFACGLSLIFPFSLFAAPPTSTMQTRLLLLVYYGAGAIGIVAAGLAGPSYVTSNVFYMRMVFAVLKGSVISVPAAHGAYHDLFPTIAAGIALYAAPGSISGRRLEVVIEYTIWLVASYLVGLLCRISNQGANARMFVAEEIAEVAAMEHERRANIGLTIVGRVVPTFIAPKVLTWYSETLALETAAVAEDAEGDAQMVLTAPPAALHIEFETALVMFLHVEVHQQLQQSTRSAAMGARTASSAVTAASLTRMRSLAMAFDEIDNLLEAASRSGTDIVKIKVVGDTVLFAGLPRRDTAEIVFSGNGGDAAAAAHGLSADAGVELIRMAQRVLRFGQLTAAKAGMHVGPLIGCVLGRDRLSFDVLGDTVNVASRLMSTAGAGEIVLSSSARTFVSSGPEHLEFRTVDRSLKGKGSVAVHVLD